MENIEGNHELKYKSIKITKILMRLIGMSYVNTKKGKLLSNITLNAILLSMVIALIVVSDILIYSKNDFKNLTYIVPCITTVLTELTKLSVFILNRQKVLNINKLMNELFWNVKYNEEERVIINDCDKVCFKNLVIYIISLQGVCWHYVLSPVFESMGKNTSERILPFPVFYGYFHFPVIETPYYETIFLCQVICTMVVCVCTTTFASIFFTINLFTATQFKILNVRLQLLCEYGEDERSDNDIQLQIDSYERMINCIRKHQSLIDYTNKVENIYCFIMLGQIFGSVFQICLCSVQILLSIIQMSNTMNATLTQTILSVEYLVGSFLQIYLYCYSSHQLIIQSENVSKAIYFSKWFKICSSQKIQKHFSLLMQIMVYRARKPCTLTVGKFCPLTLNTFTSVLNKSLSCFTLLRQTIE